MLATHGGYGLVYAVLYAVLTEEMGGWGGKEKKRMEIRTDRESKEEKEKRSMEGPTERWSKGERDRAMLQCSGYFPRAVLLPVNKQSTGLS